MYILFDIGGTRSRFAMSVDLESFDEPIIVRTPASYEEAKKVWQQTLKEMIGSETVLGVCGGIAGVLNDGRTGLVTAPHLVNWQDKPLTRDLEDITHAHVHLRNDTEIVGLGEATFGAGQGSTIMVYITVSTGVGGARIVNQVIDYSTYGFEFGHHIIDWNSGRTLEETISGSAMEAEFDCNILDVPEGVWHSRAKAVAAGVYNAMLHWSPDSIVLGGSMITKPIGFKITDIEAELKKLPSPFPKWPKLQQATLESVGGLYGAMAYLKHSHQK
jgi:predicted NBD/HSP70 family sugar kinase